MLLVSLTEGLPPSEAVHVVRRADLGSYKHSVVQLWARAFYSTSSLKGATILPFPETLTYPEIDREKRHA